MEIQEAVEAALVGPFQGSEIGGLGSCQYVNVMHMFNALQRRGLEGLGIKLGNYGMSTADQAIKTLRRLLVKDLKEMLKEYGDDQYSEQLQRIKDKERFSTLSDFFEVTREEAWDLWSASNVAAGTVFPRLDLHHHIESSIPDGYKTGLECWLLCHHGFIDFEKAEAVFGDYDT